MGQQQLLLLVLATVIVGLATVAGIQAFEQGQTRANQDALTQTAVKMASDVQAKVKEPSQFGGYDGNLGLTDGSGSPAKITLDALGYNTSSSSSFYGGSSDVYDAADGECGIESTGSTVTIRCESDQARVNVDVTSTNPEGITTTDQVIKS